LRSCFTLPFPTIGFLPALLEHFRDNGA
jgi:hypothetical protein